MAKNNHNVDIDLMGNSIFNCANLIETGTNGFYYYNDFFSGLGELVSYISGNGATNSFNIAVVSNNTPGINQMQTGTTATGRAGFGSQIACLLLGGGVLVCETYIRIPILSNATQQFILRCGLLDSFTGESIDAVYFRYADNLNSGKFQSVTRSNNVETATDTGIAVVANIWYKLAIIVNANANTISFLINNALVSTITTNIPNAAGRQLGFGSYLQKIVGNTNSVVDADYVKVSQKFTLAR